MYYILIIMKKTNLLLLFFCCLLSLSTTTGEAANTRVDPEEIDLLGNLMPDKPRSLVKPIQVFITDLDIEINFNNALGVIAISIYDETGSVVYQQSVNTYVGLQIFVDITSFDEGVYTIEFVNPKGEYLSGRFEI